MKKKLMALLLVVATMSVALVVCKKKTECAACKETKKCQEYMGEYFCDDCYDMVKALSGAFGK